MDIDLHDSDARLRALRESAFGPFSYIAMLVMAVLGFVHVAQPGGPSGYVGLSLSFLVLLNLLYYRSRKHLEMASFILVGAIGVMLMYVFYSGIITDVGSFWLVVFPLPTVLLLGRLSGTILVLAYTLGFMPVLVRPGILGVDYNADYVIYTMLAVNVVTLLVFVYERIIDHFLELSLNHNEKLSLTTKSLQQQIHERERAEDRLRQVLENIEENNRQLEEVTSVDEAVISSIGEAVIVVNEKGVTLRTNPSTGRVLGLNQSELIHQKITKSLRFYRLDDGNDEVSEEDLAIMQSITHRSIVEEQYRITRPDGSTLFGLVTVSPLVVNGAVIGAVVVVRDITQEINVDQTKTEFVSIASHQLRTPLSTINWYLEMVLAGDFGEVNEEQQEYIQEAYDSSKRMGGLIDALLNVSRIDVGVFAINPKPLDIEKTIQTVLDDLKVKTEEKKLKIKTHLAKDVGKPKLDERLMNIILMNLLSNAVKYSPPGSKVEVDVTMGSHLTIKVADHGYGIPLHQQDKIFSKLFRAENAVEMEPDGTGLGLYIVKSIVNEVGGSIGFTSKEGKGTTFTVKLPKSGMKIRKGSRELTESAGV